MTLRLLAQDADDLQVLSAALQDAVLTVGDIVHDGRARTLTLALNRYRWEAKGSNARAGERVRAALQLAGVLSVRSRNIRQGARDAVLELLSAAFEPAAEPPGGAVVLTFAGGGDLRVEVEALDAVLADVSGAWPARGRPRHD